MKNVSKFGIISVQMVKNGQNLCVFKCFSSTFVKICQNLGFKGQNLSKFGFP